jgi:hypothetical protein
MAIVCSQLQVLTQYMHLIISYVLNLISLRLNDILAIYFHQVSRVR